MAVNVVHDLQVTLSAKLVPAFNCNSVLKEAINLKAGSTDILTLHIELPFAQAESLVRRLSDSQAHLSARKTASNAAHVCPYLPHGHSLPFIQHVSFLFLRVLCASALAHPAGFQSL
jgi:hypothetical protein